MPGTHTFTALTPTPHINSCYLLRFLCLMIKRFSSVGYICASRFLSAILRFLFLLFLFLSPFSCFDPCISLVTVQQRRSGLLSPCPSGVTEGACFVFFILFLFFFFSFVFSSLPPPLGKSCASSTISLVGWSLEVGTGLLGFHGFTLPVPSCCLYFFVLGAGVLWSLSSLKKI